MDSVSLKRRPIKARDTRWAANIARGLARLGFRPNTISILSVVCAGFAATSLMFTANTGTVWRIILFIAAALFIQLRLLCNLFDGMVAVEGGFRTKSGEIFNELPDRFADAFIMVGAGYSLPAIHWAREAGWAA